MSMILNKDNHQVTKDLGELFWRYTPPFVESRRIDIEDSTID
jgi:hypothetical protein